MKIQMIAAALLCTLFAQTADAETIKFYSNREGYIFKPGDSNLKVTPEGSETFTFVPQSPGTYVFTFYGECSIRGKDGTISIGFYVNNAPLDPKWDDRIFCSKNTGKTNPNFAGRASYSFSQSMILYSGLTTVRVRARVSDGSSAWIDDTAIVVQD